MADLQVYLNGRFVPEAEAKISVFDHSFVYGDGIFEGIQAEGGVIYDLDEHVARLYRSARYLQFEIPIPPAEMRAAIVEVARKNGLRDGYLRPLVTRGQGPLGLERMRELPPPNVVVIPQIRQARGERDLTVYDLVQADELFISATMTGIAYVVELDGRKIGTGEPGPISRSLAERLREYQQRTGVRID